MNDSQKKQSSSQNRGPSGEPHRGRDRDAPETFPLLKINLYFEEVQRDRMDTFAQSPRLKGMQEVRDRLLSLPEEEFVPTLKALRSILGKNSETLKNQKSSQKTRPFREDAELYPNSVGSDESQGSVEMTPAVLAKLTSK